jgi:uncharacterized protein YceK
MKKITIFFTIIILAGCASTTYIKTIPSGAKVYENGTLKGFTPHMHWDRESGKASRTFTLQKEGYKDKVITIKKTDFNPFRLIGPPILALPWVHDYPAEYIYELEKSEQLTSKETLRNDTNIDTSDKQKTPDSTRYNEMLRELRDLKNEGLLTDEEYKRKRQEIIDRI